MKNEEINIAIAESLGWKTIEGIWVGPKNWKGEEVPKYAESLDACAEFERTLELRDLADYSYKLMDITNTTYEAITATARQRCEAYLRVKGNWRDGK